MAYQITEACKGCSVCAQKCPVRAISGEKKEAHSISPRLCLGCGVCGRYCPTSAILDDQGKVCARILPKNMPKATLVYAENCNGCEYCVNICPFDSLSIQFDPTANGTIGICVVNTKSCVGCGFCEQVCHKEAIQIVQPEVAASPKEKEKELVDAS